MAKKTWVELRNEAKNYTDQLIDEYVPQDPGNSAIKQALSRTMFFAMKQGEYQQLKRTLRWFKLNQNAKGGPD